MKDRMVWLGRHEGILREVAKGCSFGSLDALKQAALLLSAVIREDSVLVPMPSHIGYATTMLDLCKLIYALSRDLKLGKHELYSGLMCLPHESSHIVKLQQGVPPVISMYLKIPPPKGNVVIIDNTIASGRTADAALQVLPNATVLSITKSCP